jgi:protease-4
MAPLSSDYLVDRRLLQRKLSFWRFAAFLFLIGVVLVGGYRLIGGRGVTALTPHIARLSIEGVITGDKDTLKLIRDIGRSQATGVLLSIESPGGTTTGGNSLVGSIGVLFQYPNVAKLLETLGVRVEAVKSSPLKASPNGFEPTSPEARAVLSELVSDSFNWFKGLVKERRHMTDEELNIVSDGRVFTGRQGINLKLVDRLGGEREAISWLEQEKGVKKNLPVRDWKKDRSFERLGLLGFSARLAELAGFSGLSQMLERGSTFAESRLLDGLVSIWQVEPSN